MTFLARESYLTPQGCQLCLTPRLTKAHQRAVEVTGVTGEINRTQPEGVKNILSEFFAAGKRLREERTCTCEQHYSSQ